MNTLCGSQNSLISRLLDRAKQNSVFDALRTFWKKKTHNLEIRPLHSEEYPWNLLLEADPSHSQIDKYLPRSQVYGMVSDTEIVGVLVITPKPHSVMEISNICISSPNRGSGLGRQLLYFAIDRARAGNYQTLEIGTGNSSLNQLKLYQRVGFRITSIEKDFFTKNYSSPIEEEGIKCIDMIRLTLTLSPFCQNSTPSGDPMARSEGGQITP